MDPDSKHEYLERNTKIQSSYNMSNGRDVLQSIWIRYRSMVASTTDRKFMEGQCRFVLYSGIIL